MNWSRPVRLVSSSEFSFQLSAQVREISIQTVDAESGFHNRVEPYSDEEHGFQLSRVFDAEAVIVALHACSQIGP